MISRLWSILERSADICMQPQHQSAAAYLDMPGVARAARARCSFDVPPGGHCRKGWRNRARAAAQHIGVAYVSVGCTGTSRKNSAEAHLPTLSISPAIGVAELLRGFVTDGCFAVVILCSSQRSPALDRDAGGWHLNCPTIEWRFRAMCERPRPEMKAEYIV